MLIIIILLNSVSRQFWCYSISGVDGESYVVIILHYLSGQYCYYMCGTYMDKIYPV